MPHNQNQYVCGTVAMETRSTVYVDGGTGDVVGKTGSVKWERICSIDRTSNLSGWHLQQGFVSVASEVDHLSDAAVREINGAHQVCIQCLLSVADSAGRVHLQGVRFSNRGTVYQIIAVAMLQHDCVHHRLPGIWVSNISVASDSNAGPALVRVAAMSSRRISNILLPFGQK